MTLIRVCHRRWPDADEAFDRTRFAVGLWGCVKQWFGWHSAGENGRLCNKTHDANFCQEDDTVKSPNNFAECCSCKILIVGVKRSCSGPVRHVSQSLWTNDSVFFVSCSRDMFYDHRTCLASTMTAWSKNMSCNNKTCVAINSNSFRAWSTLLGGLTLAKQTWELFRFRLDAFICTEASGPRWPCYIERLCNCTNNADRVPDQWLS